jgi:hypothetical protein
LRVQTGSFRIEIGSQRFGIGSLRVDVRSLRVGIGSRRVDVGSFRVDAGFRRIGGGDKRLDYSVLDRTIGVRSGINGGLNRMNGVRNIERLARGGLNAFLENLKTNMPQMW